MLSDMRTTVTLDSDTEQIVRGRMKQRGVSFKQALNDAIRDGAASADDQRVDFVTPSFHLGTPAIDLEKALSLAGALEDDELVRKLESRR